MSVQHQTAAHATRVIASTQAFLGGQQFQAMLELVSSVASGTDDIYDLLRPFLTRHPAVNWKRLAIRTKVDSIFSVLQGCIDELGGTTEWTPEAVAATLRAAASNIGIELNVLDGILVDCLLCSEERLPIYRSICLLGRSEVTKRLRDCIDNLRSQLLVG